jgi:hypothetical protein
VVYTAYCAAVIYFLFQHNPLLYSRQDLRSQLNVGETKHQQTVPSHPEPGPAGNATFQQRYNLERTAVDPAGSPRSKNYSEFEHHPVELGVDDFILQNLTQDTSGIYLAGKSPWVFALDNDGKVRWKFRFKDVPSGSVLPVLLDDSSAYIIHPQGQVVCLDKQSGALRWLLPLKAELAASPLLWKKALIIPARAAKGVQILTVERSNGKLDEEVHKLDIKPGFELSEIPELKKFVATVDNKVILIDPEEDWQVEWTQTLTDPIKGPAVVIGTQIYAATLAAKVVKVEAAKGGKMDWEADIVKPPASAPTVIPITGRLAVLDTSGFISTIDAKNGKVFWRIPAENRNPLKDMWSARLKGQHIEEFKMDWLHKGWSIWAPCYDNSFCIYTPNKGGLVARVHLSGHPIALPWPVDHRWVFLTEPKAGHYIVSQVVEEGEIKKLKAEKTQ